MRQIGSVVKTPTLAEKLGTTPHISLLLQKAKRLGLHSPELLESLAVARGCWHYRHPDMVPAPALSESEFSNEELALVLLSLCLPYSPHTIRVGAAMLGAVGNDIAVLKRLAVTERCVPAVRYIAAGGLQFEPENPFWRRLLDQLPEAQPVKDGVMPHPTRFVAMTGFTRKGPGLVVEWQRPGRPAAAT